MDRAVSLDGIYRAASPTTKQRMDDLAAEMAVARLKAMGGDRPIAVPGPLIAFAAEGPGKPGVQASARTLVAHGMPMALSVAIHRNIPGLGGGDPPVDVVELLPPAGGSSYWFAGSPAAQIELDARSSMLVSGQDDGPDVALFSTSLQYVLAAARRDRNPPISGTLREIVSEARDRALAERFPRAVLASMSERLALIAEATASADARELTARGAPPLVPLRVERADLTGEAQGPMADVVSMFDWTVRQPVIEERSGRILHFVDGRDGVASLQRTFGDKPHRLLCLDAGRLELDSLGQARSAGRPSSLTRRGDLFRAAVAVSRARARPIGIQETRIPPSAPRRAYGVSI